MRLAFLIVGTPRSGTTLVQRFAASLPAVVSPPETHFFDRLLDRLPPFPQSAEAIRTSVERFLSLPTSRGVTIDPSGVIARLGGEAGGPVELFEALVLELASTVAPGAALAGEKTPEHLAWWRPLTRARPEVRLIGVVRDPRAVMASHRVVPWGIRHPEVLAEQWRWDVEELEDARRVLGDERCLLVRYEDAVQNPNRTLRQLGRVLRVEGKHRLRPGAPILEWEWWKQRAAKAVDTSRIDAWQKELPREEAAIVEKVAGAAMRRNGYQPMFQGAGELSPAATRRRTLHRRKLEQRNEAVQRAGLEAA